MKPRDQRGGAIPLLMVSLALMSLMCLAFADATGVIVARARASTAADAAALAAAVAQWPHLDITENPQEAATSVASANGATLEVCECPVRGETARVVVYIDPPMRILRSFIRVRAQAKAKLDWDRVFWSD